MNAREFVADMAARQQDAERSRNGQQPVDNRWRWHYAAYLFPEALCPYCAAKARREGLPVASATIRSNRIWLVDNAAAVLVGQLKLVGGETTLINNGQVVSEHPQHPHVAWEQIGFKDGYICTGNTFSISHALFSAIEPDDTLWSGGAVEIPAWLVTMFDHSCPVAPDYDAGCSEATCNSQFGTSITKPRHGLDGEVLCNRCFNRHYFKCYTCRMHNPAMDWQRRSDGCWEDRDGRPYCSEHKANAEHRRSELAEGQLDPDCEAECHCDECRENSECICGEYEPDTEELDEDEDDDDAF